MGDLIALLLTFSLFVIAYLCGAVGEKRHYASIRRREERLKHILVFNEKMPHVTYLRHEFALVSGSVVMSSDYFRQVIALLKKIFGGRLGSLESAIDRGRREAILRMKEEAESLGAEAIFNVRLDTSMLAGDSTSNGGRQKLFCAEIFAYGTALYAPGKTP